MRSESDANMHTADAAPIGATSVNDREGERLSKQRCRVLTVVAEGKTNKEIARNGRGTAANLQLLENRADGLW